MTEIVTLQVKKTPLMILRGKVCEDDEDWKTKLEIEYRNREMEANRKTKLNLKIKTQLTARITNWRRFKERKSKTKIIDREVSGNEGHSGVATARSRRRRREKDQQPRWWREKPNIWLTDTMIQLGKWN